MKHHSISIGLLLLACVLFYTACKKDQDTLAEELSKGRWNVYSMVEDGFEHVYTPSHKYHFSFNEQGEEQLKGFFVFEYGPEPYIDRDTLVISLHQTDSTMLLSPFFPWAFARGAPNLLKIRRFSQDTLIFDGTDELGGYAIIKAVRE